MGWLGRGGAAAGGEGGGCLDERRPAAQLGLSVLPNHVLALTSATLHTSTWPCSFSSGGSYRPYSAAAPPAHVQRAADEDRAPKLHKCPRCRKEYLSTINQRRCISSHLRGASGASRRGSIPGEQSCGAEGLASSM